MDDVQTYKSIERDIKEPSSLLVKNSADYSEDNHFKFQTNPTNKEPSMWRHMNAKKASNMSVSQVATALDADLDRGLTVIEAEIRKKSQGYNEFFVGDPEPLWKKFLEQFKNPLILLLLCSALVSVCMSQFDDAVSIALAVIIVSTVAFVQEYRSEKSLEELSKLLPDYCTCLRSYTKVHSSTFPSTENGPEVITLRIPARELVPGDLVMLMAGDRIPADLRLVKVRDLRVDESGFTGEAHPVKKISDVVNNQNIHLEVESEADSQYHASDFSHVHMKNIGFMGTLVRSGKGMGIVIGTGERTEFGEIFKLMKAELVPKTPLQRSMDRLGKQLSFYSIIIISLIIVLGYIRGRALLEMFTIGVSLAVAAIPEGLPIVVTVTLALGVLRMSKKKVIVKKLPTVETLGRVNVLCSDKTGTLTTNRMTVTDIYLPDEPCFEVKDLIPPFTSSNSPNNSYLNYGNQKFELDKGQILLQPQQNDNKDFSNITSRDETARNLATTAAICSDFSESYASPTETAILDLSKRISKLNGADIRAKYERIREIPFSSERKYMQVICSVKDSYAIPNIPIIIIALKGAPEIILTKCDRFYRCNNSHHGANDAHLLSDSFFAFHENQICPMTDSDRQKFTIKSQSMALNGLRVLGVAFNCHSTHKYPDFESEIKDDMCFNNNIFLGYIGIQDPVKSNVPRVIGSLQKIGIKVKMITGDSKETACSVARNIGLLSNNPIFNQYDNSLLLSGFELDRLMPEQLAECIERIVVFYRTSPIHKIKIVKALQDGRTHKSNVVAMTGDGINDALALKRADIGIAVMSFSPRVSSNPSDISLGNNSIPYNEPRPDNFDLQDTLVNTNDACKEAADMLLLDGDLSTLTICVEEGKTIYENIRNFLRFQLSTSISAMALIALSTMLFMDVPGKFPRVF
ncbi:calcium-transporting ATPase type 2C member 1-like isoform X2 [Gordionus sp. m RMFG-2023]|uniref:calcium-transporting ATPase type 2C member 1-like isoform X2 n=1 Tax=Gordionus sp. m RMFG-2023 TaxID=3053472 RepID=UPI0031FBFA04